MFLLREAAETAVRGGVSRVMSCERETRLHGDELTAVALDDESSFTFSHFDNFYNNNTELGHQCQRTGLNGATPSTSGVR